MGLVVSVGAAKTVTVGMSGFCSPALCAESAVVGATEEPVSTVNAVCVDCGCAAAVCAPVALAAPACGGGIDCAACDVGGVCVCVPVPCASRVGSN